MRRSIGGIFLVFVTFILIQAFTAQAAAQGRVWNTQPRDGACFYVEDNYRGENFCIGSNEELANLQSRFNDRISSIRVFGNADITVYENANFSGAKRTINRSIPSLGAWSNRISSLHGFRQSAQSGRGLPGRFGGRGREAEPKNGACFYSDADFRGDYFCIDSDQSIEDLEGRWNDRISSVRIFGRSSVTVYEHDNFNGSRRTIDRDMPSLGNWNDKISSIQGDSSRQFGRSRDLRDSRREPRRGACFFVDAGFRGDSFCLDAGERIDNLQDRFDDKISSIQVFGKTRVVVHEHKNFGGSSRTFDTDQTNLSGNFNDKITSIEVR